MAHQRTWSKNTVPIRYGGVKEIVGGIKISKEINWRFCEKDIDRVRKVLESNFSSSNGTSYCKELEEKFAKQVGAKYGICYSSGTTTLHGAVAVSGVGPGDEVIVPALNVYHTAASILYQNGVPVFADSGTSQAMTIFKKTNHGITNGAACLGRSASSSAYLAWSAEL